MYRMLDQLEKYLLLSSIFVMTFLISLENCSPTTKITSPKPMIRSTNYSSSTITTTKSSSIKSSLRTTFTKSTTLTSSSPFVFQPKITEIPSINSQIDYEDYYEEDEDELDASINVDESEYELDIDEILLKDDEDNIGNNTTRTTTSTSSPARNSKPNRNSSTSLIPASRLALSPLFDFAEFILRPTSPNENIVEVKESQKLDVDEDLVDEDANDSVFDDQKRINNKTMKAQNQKNSESKAETGWLLKENVCQSKIVYENEGKSQFEYWFINSCQSKIDSEFCFTKLQAGNKGFEIHSTTACCPNFHLNLSLNLCLPINKHEPNLYDLMRTYLTNINSTVQKYFKHNEKKIKSPNDRQEFTNEINSIFNELTNDSLNNEHSTRLTVFLWDNSIMIEHVKDILTPAAINGNQQQQQPLNLSRRLDQIIETIRYHIVVMHHSTHSIYSNSIQLETHHRNKQRIRLSHLDLENKTAEFVNCREIVHKNQYYKEIKNSRFDHNYRLLIHKLQDGSLLIPQAKTVFQVLTEIVLRPEISNMSSSSGKFIFSTFAKIFAKCKDLVQKDLNKMKTSVSVFVPTDSAFKQLRIDQVESLWSDKSCAYKFVAQNIVNEEICPSQLIKYDDAYSSKAQKADFIAVNENGSTSLYFNGQKLNLAKTYSASNGFIYRLSSLKLTGVVDFLYDIVVGFRRKFSSQFLASLQPSWLDIIRNESNDATLFMPLELSTTLSSLSSAASTRSPLIRNNTSTSTTGAIFHNISINDYLTKPRLTFYQLNHMDIVSSLSKRKYLITVYPFESRLNDVLSKFIPKRNLERKAINCQQLEMPDLNACNAQLIVFKSATNRLAHLNEESLLDFIRKQADLSIFNSLIEFCGSECRSMLNATITNNNQTVSQYKRAAGYTFLLPVNDYFNKALINFQKYAKNMTLFKKTIRSNVFYGTYCSFYLKNDVLIENLLGWKVKGKRVYARMQESEVYLSEKGIVVHKTNIF